MNPISRRLYQLAVILGASGIGGFVFNAGWSDAVTLGVIAGNYIAAGFIVGSLERAR